MNLYPVILTDSIDELQKQISLVEDHPKIFVVQIDIIDGFFVDNITIVPMDLLYVNFGKLKVDIHLMIEEPMDFIWELDSIKKELPLRAIIAQPERMSSQENYIEQVKKMKLKVGLSLNLHTPLEAIDEASWQKLDIIQLMGIEAGFQGKKLNEQVLEKIKELRKKDKVNRKARNGALGQAKVKELTTAVEIMIDGGVKLDNANKILAAGADSLVVGSELWQARDIEKMIDEFMRLESSFP